jgi:alpha-methylacyl-CoA racemase
LGREHEKPYAPINLVADFGGGGLMCALAIVTSLFERATNPNTTNKIIDMSMVEGAAYMSSWLWTSQDIPGVWGGQRRGANLLDGGYHAYETYRTKDGKFMACGSLEPQFYQQLIKSRN